MCIERFDTVLMSDDYKVSENEFLYVRWERTDMNAFMVLED